jgi:phosphatidylserine decarboxylase
MRASLFVLLQRLLPRYWLTAMIHRLARIRTPAVKDFLIMRFVHWFDVEVAEVRKDIPEGFTSFNDFFVRELVSGSRPVDDDPSSIVSPVDGTVSLAGTLEGGNIIQAKGIDYTLDDLLAADLDDAHAYENGNFATIYLAPYNYHRVHAPFDGELRAMHYVPGDLYSVNAATVSKLPGLFRRNERLILHFATEHGPAAVILVGALNVGSITTPWSGEIRPHKDGVVETIGLHAAERDIHKGDLLGWFNMGSTVIVLLPPGVAAWGNALEAGTTLRMGETIGRYQ